MNSLILSVTMAKGIGNGFPLAAVATNTEIAQTLASASYHNTFGGNPLACAIGSTVLDIIDDEQLQQNCHKVGTYLINKLALLRDKYGDIVGDVRGKGLMVGMELITENKRMPAKDLDAILSDCKVMGLILGKGGLHGNCFRIKPPMCINKDDVDFTVAVLEVAFHNHYERMARKTA